METRADVDQVRAGSATKVVGAATVRDRMRRARGDIDGRSAVAKRAQRLMGRFVDALGGHVGPVAMVQVRRAAELVITAEQLRACVLRGEPIDYLVLVRVENLATRAVAALGIDRKRKPAGPSLAAYLAGIRPAEPPDASDGEADGQQEMAAEESATSELACGSGTASAENLEAGE